MLCDCYLPQIVPMAFRNFSNQMTVGYFEIIDINFNSKFIWPIQTNAMK